MWVAPLVLPSLTLYLPDPTPRSWGSRLLFSARTEGQGVHRWPIAFPLTSRERGSHRSVLQGDWRVVVVVPPHFFGSLQQVEAFSAARRGEAGGDWLAQSSCLLMPRAWPQLQSSGWHECFPKSLLLYESWGKASALTQLLHDFLTLSLTTLLFHFPTLVP